jgi:hypothetical protein
VAARPVSSNQLCRDCALTCCFFRYENPDLNQPHEISNDELLNGLEGMRREGRGEPRGPAPMGSSGDNDGCRICHEQGHFVGGHLSRN